MSSSTSSSDVRRAGDDGSASLWSILTALATVLLLSAAAQHSPWLPSYLTGSENSMVKYAGFRKHVEEAGPDDLVVIGASPVAGGVDPDALSEALTSRLGRSTAVGVYNFGLGAHGALTYPFTVDLIQRFERPKLFVFAITPLAFSTEVHSWNEQTSMIRNSPYGKAFYDPLRLRGTLRRRALDHWRLAALAPSLRVWVVDGKPPAREYPGHYSARGFHPFADLDSSQEVVEGFKKELRGWRTSPVMLEAFADATKRIREEGGEVFLAEGPLRPDARAVLTEPGSTYEDFRALLRMVASDNEVPFAFLPVEKYGAEDFADHLHLNPENARINSRWLASKIADRFGDLLQE